MSFYLRCFGGGKEIILAELKKEEKKLGLGTLVRNNVFLFRIACKYAPLYVICTVVEGIAWGINNAIERYYTKMLFDMIENPDMIKQKEISLIPFFVPGETVKTLHE